MEFFTVLHNAKQNLVSKVRAGILMMLEATVLFVAKRKKKTAVHSGKTSL